MSTHHHDEVTVDHGTSPKTLSVYIIGFILCLLLTMASFGLVEKHSLSTTELYVGLAALAIAQLFVQVICFLRLNAGPEGRWNLMPFLFTILIIVVLVSGSLWIMYNMNYNMMN